MAKKQTENQKPFEILSPNERWIPIPKNDLFEDKYEDFLPPLVHKIRLAVAKWREADYNGASNTSKFLLNFWFEQKHTLATGNAFQFYFSQREAIESVIYLYEVAKAKDKYDLMRFDSSGRISTGMFDEVWTRYVVKMATGAGKTKVMALCLVWSYFHKLYENNSTLSKNFLIIAPNIIVLNRLRKDFDGFKMFFEEPFIPENGFGDKDWKNDFQLSLHIQDELKPIAETGNLFLTNTHRVSLNEEPQSSTETIFLGNKPKSDADTSKGLDLGKVLRSNKITDLVVLNDEAHHIHDPSLEWFKNITDINNKLKQKGLKGISLQTDFTATPKKNNGSIFVQTICDYPLVEAIKHNVVKLPVLPDQESRQKIVEKESSDFVERYGDFVRLGYIEWEKQYQELKTQKTPILFVMTMSTLEADHAAAFLEREYPLLKNSVLVIHTNNSGIVKETANSKKDKEELDELRNAADSIDQPTSKYKAVVSVLMLREGWDVKNVTTIVGLRPFGAKSQILPEQTIGRGLRKMFDLDTPEKLVVIGTKAFLNFVEELKTEGVEFQYSPMGKGTTTKTVIIIQVDEDNQQKNLDALDIPLALLSPRIYREHKNLELININNFNNPKAAFRTFAPNQLLEIVFEDIDGNFSHKTVFNIATTTDYRNIVAFLTNNILKESRLVSGFNILYPKVEAFICQYLFNQTVELNNPQTIRNLAEASVKSILYKTFKQAIDQLTVTEKHNIQCKGFRWLRDTPPKIVNEQKFLIPKKSVFNKIIGDNNFELEFAAALENRFADVQSFAKNTMGNAGVNFYIEYQAEDGNIREYFPDFFVKINNTIYIVELKGREDLDDIRKIKRLTVWCNDANNAQNKYTYLPIYIKQTDWDKYNNDLKSFADIATIFKTTE